MDYLALLRIRHCTIALADFTFNSCVLQPRKNMRTSPSLIIPRGKKKSTSFIRKILIQMTCFEKAFLKDLYATFQTLYNKINPTILVHLSFCWMKQNVQNTPAISRCVILIFLPKSLRAPDSYKIKDWSPNR